MKYKERDTENSTYKTTENIMHFIQLSLKRKWPGDGRYFHRKKYFILGIRNIDK